MPIVNSKYKMERRLGVNMWGLKKSAYNKKPYPPGQHGFTQRKVRLSDYGTHLAAKQMLRFYYGAISEKQFRNIFKKADQLDGNTADNFIILLESRLDSLIYRSSARALSVFASKQAVSHGHFLVNGKRANIPSYTCKNRDKIQLSPGSCDIPLYRQLFNIKNKSKHNDELGIPSYIEMNYEDKSFSYIRPKAHDVTYPFNIDIGLIVEYYSV